jgi:hypothetical protein
MGDTATKHKDTKDTKSELYFCPAERTLLFFVVNSNSQTPCHFPNLFWFRLRRVRDCGADEGNRSRALLSF